MTSLGKVTFGIIILIIVVGGFFALKKSQQKTPETIVTENVATSTTALLVAPFVTEHATTTYTTLDLSYPKSSPTEYKEIYNFVKSEKEDFIKNYGSLTSRDVTDRPSLISGELYTMTLTTHVATSSQTVSYVLELYEYTGGAHGATSVNTFTYDAKGALVTIDKVFTSPYLQVVSPLARVYLKEKLGDNTQRDMLEAGTAAQADNFSEWYLTNDTITFVFGQYQVGPYVIGLQEFPLPKSQVLDLLSPQFK